MIIYSTCTSCGKLMEVVERFQATHVNCRPKETTREEYKRALMVGDDLEIDRLGTILDRPLGRPRLLEAALAYARWGWPVFPLRPGLKTPATRNGFKDATTDEDRIRDYWTRRPGANIGLPTGVMFDVIDFDAPECWPSYRDMIERDAIPPVHAEVCTPRGGWHLYVQPSGEGNRAGILPGVDIRGVGGYVVAPPSVSTEREGQRYVFLHKPSPLIRKSRQGQRKEKAA